MHAVYNRRPWREYEAEVRRQTRTVDIEPVRSERTGRPKNAFCTYVDPADGSRVARYHDTDILRVDARGNVRITFDGWHTFTTRARFNEAAALFGLPLRACAAGSRGSSFIYVAGGSPEQTWILCDRFLLTLPAPALKVGS